MLLLNVGTFPISQQQEKEGKIQRNKLHVCSLNISIKLNQLCFAI